MTILQRLMKWSLFHRPKAVTGGISIEDRVSYLKSRNEYFHYHASKQPLFLPEFEISKEILEVIEAVDKTHEERFMDIADIYNKITHVDHYDGSGWFDFQLILGGYFLHFGYSTNFDRDTGLMTFEKII